MVRTTNREVPATPDLMPVLSRGKHRSPRKGACFMELASYLAGEPWSDHPRCTHPVLATLARAVNDNVGDAARLRLAPLIPEVIGLSSDDPRAEVWIALDCARAALPVAAAEKQNVAAVAIMNCERHLARLEDRPYALSPESRAALDRVPYARDWAHLFLGSGTGSRAFNRRTAPAIVHSAVAGIAMACTPDTDERLVGLLARTIESCRGWFDHAPAPVADTQWQEVCRLTAR